MKTEIIFVTHYTRELVTKNPNSLFVFGDNCLRRGLKGQAVIRGLKNAIGIATKFAPSMTHDSFFSDNEFIRATDVIFKDIENIKETLNKGQYSQVVFPYHGLGTGLAKLEEKAPKVNAFLLQKLYDDFGIDCVKNSDGSVFLELIKK